MKITTTSQTMWNFIRTRDYLVEIVKARPAWITPLVHLKIFGFKPIFSFLIRIPALRDRFLDLDWIVKERVLENNWIYRFLHYAPQKARILDIGCATSKISFELANMGYKVTGIDLRNNPLEHPNLSFVFADVCQMPFGDATFDLAMAISTIEHVGIAFYDLAAFPDGDVKALAEIRRCLKPGGLLYLTIPFGKKETTWARTYNFETLAGLLKDFEIIESKYYLRQQNKFWFPSSAQEAEASAPYRRGEGSEAVAIMLCKRPFT